MSLTVTSGQTKSLTSTTSGATVFSAGTLDVLSGGVANAAQVDGLLQVSAGGTASGATLSGSATMNVFSGGVASGTIVNGTEAAYPGAVLSIAAGGSAIGTLVSNGTEAVAGTASGTVVSGFLASQTVQSGGLAIATSVGGGNGAPEQVVSQGGSARDTVVSGGGTEMISGGTATGIDLLAVNSAGMNAYLYLYGGTAGLAAGDVASGDVIDFAGGSATLAISGTTMPTATLSNFDSAGPTGSNRIDLASVAFSSGGSAVLGSGNVLSVTEGGASYTLAFDPSQSFLGEAFQLAADGASGTAITLAYSGFVVTGGETTSLTSAVSAATVFAGGTLDVLSGGVANAALVEGLLQVSAGGSASATTVKNKGEVIVSAGGVASATVIDGTSIPGATLLVAAGGSAVGTVVNDGAEEVAGTASGTVVSGFAASQTVLSGGLAIATSVGGGNGGAAEQIVSQGGSASGTVVSGGGTEIISGGTATGLDLLGVNSVSINAFLYLYGGTAGLAVGDLASQDVVVFAGGSAALVISGTTMPTAMLSGFDSAGPTVGDRIDLASVAFSSGGSAVLGSGNVLSVTEGGTSATLIFAPSQSFAGEAFQLAADGASGTAITLAYSGFVVTSGVTASLTSALSGATVFAGGTLDVLSGGVANAAQVDGLLQVSAGGTASGAALHGQAEVIVSAGGVASGTIVNGTEAAYPGAILLVAAGGSAVGTVVSNGMEAVAGTASGTVVSGFLGSQTVQSGGLAIATSVGGGNGGDPEQIVSQGGSARGTVVSGGGTEMISGGTATGLDLLAVNSAGMNAYLYLYGGTAGLAAGDVASGDVIDFAGGSATLAISGTTMPTATLSNFDSAGPTGGDRIDLASIAFSSGGSAVLGSGNVLSVTEGGASYTLAFNPSQSFAGEAFQLTADGASGTAITLAPPCYAAGTRIATPSGEVPVETLREGDPVLARTTGAWAAQRVRWVGRVRVDLARHPQPERAAPVRIRADAFAPGVPQRDLLLSPDHAVFVDGALIQAQMLVNGASIVRDRPAAITYVHVELDQHALLCAEGLAAESFLDTGNRGLFAGEAGTRALHPDLAGAAAWDARACAPLLLGGARVAAAHAALCARAEASGFARTKDPALTVLAGAHPLARDAAGRFLVPAGTRTLRLQSRVFVPRWFGEMDDRRLGVAVRAVRLDGRPLPSCAFGTGWHAPERHWRWTSGEAVLLLPHHDAPAPRRLRVGLAPLGRYWHWQAGNATAAAAPTAAAASHD